MTLRGQTRRAGLGIAGVGRRRGPGLAILATWVGAWGWGEVGYAQSCAHPYDNIPLSPYGDVNASGTVSIADAVCALLVTLQLPEHPTPACLAPALHAVGADVNCDGVTNVSDVLLIITAALAGPSSDHCPTACAGCAPPDGSSCFLGGGCVPEGAPHPSVDCQVCDPQADPGAWTTAPNLTSCGVGFICLEGACEPAAPGAPTDVVATAGDGKAMVSFAAPASQGGTPITLYEVHAIPGGATATGGQSPIEVTGLDNGVAYTFRVRAQNSAGWSGYSDPSPPVTPLMCLGEPDGAECDDGDPCTTLDLCQGEVCVGGNPPDEPDFDGDGVPDVCDNCPATFNPSQDPAACAIVTGGLLLHLDADHPESWPAPAAPPPGGQPWLDLSGAGHDATAVDVGFEAGAPHGLRYDANASQRATVAVPNLPQGNQPFTGEVWLTFEQHFTFQSALEWGTPFATNQRAGLLISTDRRPYFVGQSNDFHFGTVMDPHTVYQAVFTHDGATVRMYLNGALIGSTAKTLNVQGNTVYVGVDNTRDLEPFKGTIHQVRVYDRALSLAEVQTNFEADKPRYGWGVPACAGWLARGRDADGVYQVQPPGGAPAFSVFCDQTTRGGGWTLVWKNTGGPAGSASDQTLFTTTGVSLARPHLQVLGSQRHQKAWSAYSGSSGREWLKLSHLWQSHALVHTQDIRVELQGTTMAHVMSLATSSGCFAVSQPVRLWANDVYAGQTNRIFAFSGIGVGLANTDTDTCGQSASNLIGNPHYFRLQSESTLELSTSGGWNAVRHLFSYEYAANDISRSRCNYRCWGSQFPSQPFYDGYGWYVR